MPDHVDMVIPIPPKYLVSNVVGYINGKSAIHLARVYSKRKRNVTGQSFWARGKFVSTVGRDEKLIRKYIQIMRDRMRGWISWGCGDKRHRVGDTKRRGRVRDPDLPL